MRPLTLASVLLMLLCISSCSTSWQYITLNSHEVTKDASKRFDWENDTLRLVYDYNGYGGPIWVSLTNKTGNPMYINWKKSAIVYEGYATSLFRSDVHMTGAFYAARGYTSSAGVMAGSFSVPEGMDFIPPGSTITKNFDLLIAGKGVDPNNLTSHPITMKAPRKHYYGPTTYKVYSFDDYSSPMQFRMYLTFVIDGDNAKQFAVDHAFYASEVIVASQAPEFFSVYKKHGDLLYIPQKK